MLKLSKEDFMEEVVAELYGYEEITEDLVQDFIKRLNAFFAAKKGKKVDYKNGITIKLKDESDLFMIADKYFAAVTSEELDKYWQNWDI